VETRERRNGQHCCVIGDVGFALGTGDDEGKKEDSGVEKKRGGCQTGGKKDRRWLSEKETSGKVQGWGQNPHWTDFSFGGPSKGKKSGEFRLKLGEESSHRHSGKSAVLGGKKNV